MEAELRKVSHEQWQGLFEIADAMTEQDREVTYGGGEKNADGVTQWPYPIYSDRVSSLYRTLPGANVDWIKWMSGNVLCSDIARLTDAPAADAARLATVYTPWRAVQRRRLRPGRAGRHHRRDHRPAALLARVRALTAAADIRRKSPPARPSFEA
ncbi:DUF6508 domain-containing protein [Nocardioides albertanoniae]|uniref:DUF6508 domain-containing protein n=1 Tax=Nocardioides albertanoniae TaxID=1175486 RepID=UPI002482FF01|nr:DUF6508 domain-containing protein [Nocardioides albertanoniae]